VKVVDGKCDYCKMIYMESHNAAHNRRYKMIIHSTKYGHVIETTNKVRPFRICRYGTTASFSSLEAASKALKEYLDSAIEETLALRSMGISC